MSQLKAKWYKVRNDGTDGVISSADSDLTGAQKTWDYFTANHRDVKAKTVPLDVDQVELAFACKNADTDTFTAVVYACRESGDIEFVCTVAGTAGSQQTNDSTPRFYADTFASTSDRWPSDVFYIDSQGNNGIAKIVFDLRERRHVIVLFTAISGSDNVEAIMSWA